MARSFNGTTDKIVLNTNFHIGSTMSFSGWVYVTQSTGGVIIGNVTSNNGYCIRLDNTTLKPDLLKQNEAVIGVATSGVSQNTWAHIGCRYTNSSGAWAWFVNGSPAGSGTNVQSPSAVELYEFGQAGNGDVKFKGNLAEIAIWNVALANNEFSGLALGSRVYNVRKNALVGYWPLDGLSSPEPDFSGNAYNGTLTGTALANGPPITLFTPKSPMLILPPAPPTTAIYVFNQVGAHISKAMKVIGY